MNLLHDDDRYRVEDGVRTMLHRLASGVTERPPAWEDLVGRRDPGRSALGVPAPIAGVRDRRPRPERRARLSMAAAAVLLLGVAGALVVDRPDATRDDGARTETISVTSPGDPSFDAGAAARQQ